MRTGSCAMASLWLMTMSIASSSAGQMVAGRVRDRESKRPLREVTVVLLADTGKSSHAAARATTDSLGIFYLTASSPGVYRLLFATGNDTLLSGYLALGQDEMVLLPGCPDSYLTNPPLFDKLVNADLK
jgi:carboxypeptidase family protein